MIGINLFNILRSLLQGHKSLEEKKIEEMYKFDPQKMKQMKKLLNDKKN